MYEYQTQYKSLENALARNLYCHVLQNNSYLTAFHLSSTKQITHVSILFLSLNKSKTVDNISAIHVR